MTPSGEAVGDDFSSQVDDETGQWEDYTCQGTFEELVRSVELVLREWRACDTDLVTSNEAAALGNPPASSYSRTLEHDGQLFSIQLVPPPEHLLPSSNNNNDNNTAASAPATTPATPRATPGTAAVPEKATAASKACELGDRQLDFACCAEVKGEATITPLHRWFGLRQCVLLRALGERGHAGMGIDQLLWTTTVAAGNCQSSVPVLVSCDWDGLVEEPGSAGGGVQSGASCKGYSAPGSKGVACSVRFQTAWTEKPSPEFLYLDGLTDLFLSKIKDAHCLPGRAFATVVSTTVQQSWEWTKPEGAETPMPAPALPWERAGRGDGCGVVQEEGAAAVAAVETRALGECHRGRVGHAATSAAPSVGASMRGVSQEAVAGEKRAARGVVGARQDAVRKLLRAISGGSEVDEAREVTGVSPLWGPDEDPLVSLSVRVRWAELRDGLVEESQHYTTLDPLPEEAAGGAASAAGSGGQWFVSPRWRPPGVTADANSDGDNSAPQRQQGTGRLGDACCRLLGALVLTTAMHPGTLMADLGAGPLQDGPTALAEDYGKAASAALSAETKEAVEVLCSRAQSPSIDHDEIDLILRYLLYPRPEERGRPEGGDPDSDSSVTEEGHHHSSSSSPSSSQWRTVHPGRAAAQESRRTSSEWTQVYPRPEGAVDGESSERAELGQWPQGSAAKAAAGSSLPRADAAGGEGGGAWGPWKLSAPGRGGAVDERTREEKSLWAWAERGGVPIGRLLSLLALRVADCEDLSSMSLLWMSFVRDVRLLWEDGAALARMGPIPEVDGTSMFDRSASCTGQDRSVASRLRSSRQELADVDGADSRGRPPGSERGRQDRSLPLYPDTRTCLIWQKLQMLNCCRAAVAAQAELQPPPSSSAPPGSGSGAAAEEQRGEEVDEFEDEDDEDEDFYDTQEYYQTSEDEAGELGGESGGWGGHPEVLVAGGDQEGLGGLGLGELEIEETGVAIAGGDAGGDAAGDAAGEGNVAQGNDDGPEDHARGDHNRPEDNADASDSGAWRQQPHGEVQPAPPPEQEPSATTHIAADTPAAAGVPPVEAHQREEPERGSSATADAVDEAASPAPPAAEAPPTEAAEAPAEDDVEEPPLPTPTSTGASDEPTAKPLRATPHEILEIVDADCPSKQTPAKEEQERKRAAVTPCGEQSRASPMSDHLPVGEIGCDFDSGGGEPISSDETPPSSTTGLAQEPPLKEVKEWGSVSVGDASASTSTTENASPAAALAPDGIAPGDPAEERPASANISIVTAAAAVGGVPAGDSGDRPQPRMCRLLCTGAPVRHPWLEDSGPVTSDMLEQQTVGQASTYRGREVLLADMKAFRMENGRGVDDYGGGGGGGGSGAAVFADFVRWYRPDCWQGTTAGDEWIGPSQDRVGGAEEDDRRLAWPGQGQILWRSPLASHSRSEDGLNSSSSLSADDLTPSVPPSVTTLAGWLSCWGEAGAAVEEAGKEDGGRALQHAPLFRDVKEGEKALHFLETISPDSLLVQLLSGLLGLSVFILEEGCSGAGSLPAVQASVEAARGKVVEAVELLAGATTSKSTSATRIAESGTGGSTAGTGGGDDGAGTEDSRSRSSSSSGSAGGDNPDFGRRAEGSSLSPFRAALLAADGACVAVKKAETALARAVSLDRSLPGQRDLVNAIVTACNEKGVRAAEAPVVARSQKEFLRDLLLAQGIQKTPGSELDDLLASFDEEHRQEGVMKEGSGVDGGGGGVMPPPRTKEYVLRCQTPAPFCSRNVGRGQLDAYPTPPSRMYAKTDGKNLRVALSLCESEI
eukprot:g17303.t1